MACLSQKRWGRKRVDIDPQSTLAPQAVLARRSYATSFFHPEVSNLLSRESSGDQPGSRSFQLGVSSVMMFFFK